MRMIKLTRLLPLMLVAILLLPARVISAETASGQGLEISPPVIEATADPGQQITLFIKLRNVTTLEVSVTARSDDFLAAGETGDPKLLLEPGEVSPYGLKEWVAPIAQFSIKPQQQVTVNVTLNVPTNATAGGHFGVVCFTPLPPGQEPSAVSLSARICSLVLLKVSGDAKESLELVEFFASYKSKRGSWFETGPLTFTERIKNSGTVHSKPVGTVEIFGLFGKKVATLKVNDPPKNILPDSIRRFDQTWQKVLLIGPFTAKLNLAFGDQTLTGSLKFWVFPWKLLLALLVAIITVIWTIRRYNRFIIRRSR